MTLRQSKRRHPRLRKTQSRPNVTLYQQEMPLCQPNMTLYREEMPLYRLNETLWRPTPQKNSRDGRFSSRPRAFRSPEKAGLRGFRTMP
jgi:hypothetical protein